MASSDEAIDRAGGDGPAPAAGPPERARRVAAIFNQLAGELRLAS